MGKDKRPRKPKPPTPDQNPREEELEQPVRLPQRRSLPPQRQSPAPTRPVFYDLLQTIRAAVGAMLDIADAAADAITRQLEGRA